MRTIRHSSGRKHFIFNVLVVQIVTFIATILDIPVARQVMGFLYLTFVPGLVLLRIIDIDRINIMETALLSVGLSIALLTIIGFFVNQLSIIASISRPLSQTNLILILSSSVTLLLVLYCTKVWRSSGEKRWGYDVNHMHRRTLIFSSLASCLPILSIIGTSSVNSSGDNLILLLMFMLISASVLLASFFDKYKINSYAILILSIAMALMLQESLISKYIHGHDIHLEYYVFRQTESSLKWDPKLMMSTQAMVYNSMLSITVLPAIYAAILNISGTLIFKIIYPIIFSFVSLGLYRLYRTQMKNRFAFLSVFLCVANLTFIQPTSNAKQMIAELLYVLLFYVFFSKRFHRSQRSALIIVFGFALVASHYSTSYIFLFLTSLTVLSVFLFEKVSHKERAKKFAVSSVLLLSSIAFLWYIYVCYSAPFNNLTETADHIFKSTTTEFLDPASRSERVTTAVTMGSSPSFWHTISRIYFLITEFLILVGFILLIARKTEFKFDHEYNMITAFNLGVVLLCIIVPGFASSLNMDRLYHFSVMFLSPLCIIGGLTALKLLSKRSLDLVLILVLLIPLFLFQYGFVFEITDDPVPTSISLSIYRWGEEGYQSEGLIHENELCGGEWLSEYAARNYSIYADGASIARILQSGYVTTPSEHAHSFSQIPKDGGESYIFIRQYNIVSGKVVIEGERVNITDFLPLHENIDKSLLVYSNAGSMVYRTIGG